MAFLTWLFIIWFRKFFGNKKIPKVNFGI
jgi:hypothetical protein